MFLASGGSDPQTTPNESAFSPWRYVSLHVSGTRCCAISELDTASGLDFCPDGPPECIHGSATHQAQGIPENSGDGALRESEGLRMYAGYDMNVAAEAEAVELPTGQHLSHRPLRQQICCRFVCDAASQPHVETKAGGGQRRQCLLSGHQTLRTAGLQNLQMADIPKELIAQTALRVKAVCSDSVQGNRLP